jgi:putative ABC transport system permease protein
VSQDLDRAGISNHQLPHCTLLVGLVRGVRPGDPPALSGVTLLLLVVALVASYLPALRSARTNPIVALRYE